jgi:hypothetical protein
MNYVQFPITRKRLQTLRGGYEDEKLRKKVDTYVRDISYEVLNWAKHGTTFKYHYILPKDHEEVLFYTLHVNNLMTRIRANFPDCTVRFTSMAEMNDGVLIDTCEISPSIYQYVLYKKIHTCVSVDWS